MFLIDKRSERIIADINTIGINLKLCAGSTILKVVFTIVLSHRSPFGEWSQSHFIVVVHPETFPSVVFRLKSHNIVNFADWEEVVSAQLHPLQGILVA